jgi:hypothetical protein
MFVARVIFGLFALSSLACLAGGCTQEASRDEMAGAVGAHSQRGPSFGDQVLYMGDAGGYRYVHLRRLGAWTGDREFKVPAAQWAMSQPFPYSENPARWRDVTWMDQDAPGFPRDPALHARVSFPEGAPRAQPFQMPATTQSQPGQTMPASERSGSSAVTPRSTAPTTQPASRP